MYEDVEVWGVKAWEGTKGIGWYLFGGRKEVIKSYMWWALIVKGFLCLFIHCFTCLLFIALMRERFVPEGYENTTWHLMLSSWDWQQFISHIYTQPGEEDITCHAGTLGGCTCDQSEPAGLWEAGFVLSRGWGALVPWKDVFKIYFIHSIAIYHLACKVNLPLSK